MVAYVSKELCQRHHNITFDCNITSENFIAGIRPGKFQGNPDIAGVGVSYIYPGYQTFEIRIALTQ